MWWSFLLSAVSVTGMYFTGNGKRLGWMIGLGSQTLWMSYAIATHQYGFIIACFAYGTVYIRNLRKWSKTPPVLVSNG